MSSHRIFLYTPRQVLASRPRIRPAVQNLLLDRNFCPQRITVRDFTSSSRQSNRKSKGKESFGTRLRTALNDTKIQWKPVPIGLGIASLGLLQFYRINQREKANQNEERQWEDGEDGRPKRRPRIRPSGPWLVSIDFRYMDWC